MTLTPESPWALQNNNLYLAVDYAGCSLAGNEGFVDTEAGYRSFDPTSTATTSQMFVMEIRSDRTSFTGDTGSNLMLHLYVLTSSGEYKAVPIAGAIQTTQGSTVTPSLCSSDSTYCRTLSSGFYLGAKYTVGATLRVGFFPSEICSAVNTLYGQTANGCTAGTLTTPTDTTLATMTMVVVIGVADTGELANKGGDENDESPTTLINYQCSAPTLDCPASQSVYFPGDGAINLFPGRMSTTRGASGSGAPASRVLVVADSTALTKNNTSSDLNTNVNDLVERVIPVDAAVLVSGFTNAEDYDIEFNVSDAAGIVRFWTPDPASDVDCAYGPVVVSSSIGGFLGSSRCFVATATFESEDAPQVELFRNLRDRILRKTWLGDRFTRWYYSWSPQAADWLMEHPEFRGTMLRAFVPLQWAAWLLLNPLVMAALIGAFFLSVVGWFVTRSGLKS